jgi:hypothetical protein
VIGNIGDAMDFYLQNSLSFVIPFLQRLISTIKVKTTVGNVIITHLVDGDPQGIRSIFIKNKTCQMFVIPRQLYAKATENKDIDLRQPALYIILENAGTEDGEKPRAYIGHAEDVGKRINQHLANPDKTDFFDVVLVFVAKDSSINKADVQYLENKAIKDAQSAGRYLLKNEYSGTSFFQLDQLD